MKSIFLVECVALSFLNTRCGFVVCTRSKNLIVVSGLLNHFE